MPELYLVIKLERAGENYSELRNNSTWDTKPEIEIDYIRFYQEENNQKDNISNLIHQSGTSSNDRTVSINWLALAFIGGCFLFVYATLLARSNSYLNKIKL